ncbi:hypothetical protein BKA66DRAFT_511358 [Pyrenochaeta sp. MPI-SDFR-AT-0127]|nr:hypothetical protein BKA66DRAFT_511358 [Pyrenochaeta sp. MPI-SDFR-AT-0127]
MGWTLYAPDAVGSNTFPLTNEGIAHIVTNPGSTLEVVPKLSPKVKEELGRITVGAWGAKLEAIGDTLRILPSHASSNGSVAGATDPRTESYELRQRTKDYCEVILLRHGDLISSTRSTAGLICKWDEPEIQVSSSAADAVHVKPTGSTSAAEASEDVETEDEDPENTIVAVSATQSKSQQSRATPRPSNQRSPVVQETPTAARVIAPTNFSMDLDIERVHVGPIKASPLFKTADQADAEEAFSTAHTGESQNRRLTDDANRPSRRDQIVVAPTTSKKRFSPAAEENEGRSASRARKRAKTAAPSQDDSEDSRASNIVVYTSREAGSAVKGKKRSSEVSEAAQTAETIPTRSQRSSQHSTSTAAEPYTGSIPRVALSNSSIVKSSQAVKFLKKQGGALVESLNDHFNILCVRDGDLHKTSKVLQSIALGIPIVTDKWLFDSAKAGHFLVPSAYRPSAPMQEKEWKTKLDDILDQPQTPFEGYTIHFTQSLKASYKPFTEIEQVCKAAGAKKVTSGRMDKSGNIIVLARQTDDDEAEKLMQDGVTCYNRDLLTHSIFRGVADLDSKEFKINLDTAPAGVLRETKKVGRKGK